MGVGRDDTGVMMRNKTMGRRWKWDDTNFALLGMEFGGRNW